MGTVISLYHRVRNSIYQPNNQPALNSEVPRQIKPDMAAEALQKLVGSKRAKNPDLVTRTQQINPPAFVTETGRVSRSFEDTATKRCAQGEQILKSFGKWPPKENEIFLIQIDQDSPPPPPPAPKPSEAKENYLALMQARTQAQVRIHQFLARYTGQSVLFRAVQNQGQIQLVELNPSGPFLSASHASQISGDVSCNDGICGMAWLRSGVYPYKGKNFGLFNPLEDRLMKVARDIDRDGVVDEIESKKTQHAHGFAIQIHAGFSGSPRSTGCQTFPPNDFSVLAKLIGDAKVDAFSYVLVRRPNEKFGAHPW